MLTECESLRSNLTKLTHFWRGYFGPKCILFGLKNMCWGYTGFMCHMHAHCTKMGNSRSVGGIACYHILFLCNRKLGYTIGSRYRTLCTHRIGCLVSYFWSPTHVLGDVTGVCPYA
ncbi:hypothetical protein HanHA300_Chr14g0509681 [Helianthus annuus]|nr:hypothetical protein HanHA300_Chr14g0509681 [Helianthus annuus]